MRTKTTLASLVLFGLSVVPAMASHPASIAAGTDANDPTTITADINCQVAEVRDDSTLVLIDDETRGEYVVQLDDKVKIRARSKKDFNGRKKLGLADLRQGQKIKVTVYIADGSIRSITVLEKA